MTARPTGSFDISESARPADKQPRPESVDKWIERTVVAFLAGCTAFLLYVSTWKILEFDEMLSYYTERVPTARAMLAIQSTVPVALDPPLYHLMGHWVLSLGMNPAMSVRLPSLLGSLLMMAGVYLFARRLAGSYVAILSVCGLIIANSFHMAEARPYGVLLGATGLSLLLWQNALRGKARNLSLLGLLVALGVAVSSHYFGILVAVPFLVVECVRWAVRRKLDVLLMTVLLGSYAAVLAWLPFLKAAHEYKAQYYIRVKITDLLRAYTSPFDSIFKIQSASVDLILLIAIVLMVFAGAYFGWRTSRSRGSETADWVLVAVLAVLPFFGVALAAAASGAFETRYVLEFGIGLAITMSTGLMYIVRARVLRNLIVGLFALLTGGALLHGAIQARRQAVVLALCAKGIGTDVPVVASDDEEFVTLHQYYGVKEPKVANVVWVADMNREVAFSGTDNIDRTMLNLSKFTDLPVISYEELTQKYQVFGLIENKFATPPNWIGNELHRDNAEFIPKANVGDDSVFQVRLPSK